MRTFLHLSDKNITTPIFGWGLLFIFCLLGGLACNKPASYDETEAEAPAAQVPENSESPSTHTEEVLEPQAAQRISYSFANQFPLLDSLIAGDTLLHDSLASYARRVATGEDIKDDQAILQILQEREQYFIPELDPFIANMDAMTWDQAYPRLERELNHLGMQMIVGEGMYAGLGQYRFMESVLESRASEALKVYTRFLQARTSAQMGEYPYSDMHPYIDMVLAGNQLKALPGGAAYFASLKEEYERALIAVTDIHLVEQEEHTMAMVGDMHTEPYPYLSNLEAQRKQVASADSAYFTQVLAGILTNPSTISASPQEVYLIVVEWHTDKDSAFQKRIEYLGKGWDIPHCLTVDRGKENPEIALVYRFFEKEALANAGMDALEHREFPAHLVMVSVRQGELFQLGI